MDKNKIDFIKLNRRFPRTFDYYFRYNIKFIEFDTGLSLEENLLKSKEGFGIWNNQPYRAFLGRENYNCMFG